MAQMAATNRLSCTEIVHKDGDPSEIAAMLNDRFAKGWILDRIIDHMLPERMKGGVVPPKLMVYYFRLDPDFKGYR